MIGRIARSNTPTAPGAAMGPRPAHLAVAAPWRAYATPWVSIALGSWLMSVVMIANQPIVPPLGFLMLLGWRQLHPGLLPVWSGALLGLVDDLFSGQPLGSGVALWSVAMLALDVVEMRFPWRNFLMEWLMAGVMIALYLLAAGLAALPAGAVPHGPALMAMAPQVGLAVLVYPVVGRLVAWLDGWRLGRRGTQR